MAARTARGVAGRARRPPASIPAARDLGAKREAFAAGRRPGSLGRRRSRRRPDDVLERAADASARHARRAWSPARPIIPGERRYRDGDRDPPRRWGDGIVVTSKLTRDDEEVTVAFHDPQVGRKTMLASLANLELIG